MIRMLHRLRVGRVSAVLILMTVGLGAAQICAALPTHVGADTVIDSVAAAAKGISKKKRKSPNEPSKEARPIPSQAVPSPPPIAIGDTVNFGFTDLDGHHRTLAEFRGKYVLLDIWGTWCHGCREEMQTTIDTYKTYKQRGLEIIGIANEDVYGTPTPGDAAQAAFLKEKTESAWKLFRKIPWIQTSTLVAQRPGEELLALIPWLGGGRRYPYHVLIDSTGKLIENDQDQLSMTALDVLLDRTLPEEAVPAESRTRQ